MIKEQQAIQFVSTREKKDTDCSNSNVHKRPRLKMNLVTCYVVAK